MLELNKASREVSHISLWGESYVVKNEVDECDCVLKEMSYSHGKG